MKKWVCSVCGYVYEGENPPEKCPQCGVPASKFTEQKGELSWAAEHVVGVGKSFGESVPAEVQKEIIDGLNANFTGECTEVGMYLAMSRVAYREGYAEIGEYWRRAALEEAEHAAKFAEMLGEGYTELENIPEGVDSAYQSELGYAFNVHAAGFSGDLHILVAIDNNGAIIASKLYQHTETPNEYEGIDGSKLAKSSYSKKWIGVTAETPDSELPMVSKATYTSNGYKEAVKLAFAAFETVKGA